MVRCQPGSETGNCPCCFSPLSWESCSYWGNIGGLANWCSGKPQSALETNSIVHLKAVPVGFSAEGYTRPNQLLIVAQKKGLMPLALNCWVWEGLGLPHIEWYGPLLGLLIRKKESVSSAKNDLLTKVLSCWFLGRTGKLKSWRKRSSYHPGGHPCPTDILLWMRAEGLGPLCVQALPFLPQHFHIIPFNLYSRYTVIFPFYRWGRVQRLYPPSAGRKKICLSPVVLTESWTLAPILSPGLLAKELTLGLKDQG